jgi:hypothetical protein
VYQITLTRQLDVETPYKKRVRVATLTYLATTIERPIAHRCGLFVYPPSSETLTPTDSHNAPRIKHLGDISSGHTTRATRTPTRSAETMAPNRADGRLSERVSQT